MDQAKLACKFLLKHVKRMLFLQFFLKITQLLHQNFVTPTFTVKEKATFHYIHYNVLFISTH